MVGLYALTNGRGPKPVAGLELCGLHERELLRLFRVRGRVEGTAKPKPRAPLPKGKQRGLTQRVVLAWLKTQKGWRSRLDVAKATKLDGDTASNALSRLRIKKLVRRSGDRRSARWQIS